MPFYQDGIFARRKTSSMDDSAIEISEFDFNQVIEHQKNGGSVSMNQDGTIEYHDPPVENLAAEKQAIAEAVVLQHMVKEKVAELQWEGSDKQYHVGDVVYHNGSMWRATSNNSNNEPDDVPGDWEKVI